jgi:oxygen-dependent protoporphyrinogen oxidase
MTPRRARRIVIVGGGVTGLAAAHRLLELSRERGAAIVSNVAARAGSATGEDVHFVEQPESTDAIEILLLDAAPRLGGVVATVRRDGFLLEEGPDSFLTEKPWAFDLAIRLGLAEHVIRTRPEYRRSFVVHRGRLHPTPEGFQLLAPGSLRSLATSALFSTRGKLRMAADLVIPPRRTEGDECLAQFVRRRLGREALERIAEPMIAGIYGAGAETLSLESTLPRFRRMEREHGSVIRGLWAESRRGVQRAHTDDTHVREGNEPADDACAHAGRACAGAAHARTGDARAQRPHVRDARALGARRGTSRATGGAAASRAASGARYGLFASFDAGMQTLADALSARVSHRARCGVEVTALERASGGWLVHTSAGVEFADAVILALPSHVAARLLARADAELARLVASVPYGSTVTVSIAYNETQIAHPLDGAGFVVSRAEGVALLGCTFAHRKYGGRTPEGFALLRAFLAESAMELSDAEIAERTHRALASLLGITGTPRFAHVARFPASMPRYLVGHRELVARMRERLAHAPGLVLAGNAYDGVGVPDCVRSGESAAEAAMTGVFSPARSAVRRV